MMQSEFVKKQFNKQAQRFSDWAVTKNLEYLKGITEFVAPNPEDTLLDVACGTGEFAFFISPKLKHVTGIDVSDKMIEIARKQKQALNIEKTDFKIAEVSRIPFPEDSFDIVFSKSAFHHFGEASRVFTEMVRCCKPNGTVGICDIVAFENSTVDNFFEKLEKEVDASHHQTLSRQDFFNLFQINNMKVEKLFEVEIEHTISEYLLHAVREDENEKNIDLLIQQAKSDKAISSFWTFGNGREDTKFRKKVILASGRKTT
jgi:ubiquinone/menaquinone biosynthesis C-methylase UbiE